MKIFTVDKLNSDINTNIEKKFLNILAENILKTEDEKIRNINNNYLELNNELNMLSNQLKEKNDFLKQTLSVYNKNKIQLEIYKSILNIGKQGLLTGSVRNKIKKILEDMNNYSSKKLQEINDGLSKYNPRIKKISYQ